MAHSASEADSPSSELPRLGDAPLQFGKYRLSRLLARGGMGEVYLARFVGELGFEKRLVIKTILPELAAKRRFIELFAAEAKTAVALSHGNIVPTYELGRSNDTFYIVMGYVDGPPVAQMLAALRHAGKKPDLAAVMHIIRGVLAGLAYAHHEEPGRPAVVHRDITPRNVLLDRSGQVRIVDFGIAAPAKAEGGVRAGSTGFVAPEQARGDVPDPRADVFSVGCLLYELCTLERAFPKRGVWLAPDLDALPEPLRKPVAAAIAFEADDRPRDGGALLALLRPAINEYAGSFDDQQFAAYLRELFPDGWSRGASERSGANPIIGYEGENQTFATRLTSVTGMSNSRENEVLPDGALDPSLPDGREETEGPARSDALLEPSRAREPAKRGIPYAPLLLGAAVIGALALAFRSDDDRPTRDPVVAPAHERADAKRERPADPLREPAREPEPIETKAPDPIETEPAIAPPERKRHDLAVEPADAELLVGGKPLEGESPYTLELPAEGKLVVEVRKTGYEPRRLELDAADDTLPSKVSLEKLKPRDPGFLMVTAPGVNWAEVRIDGRKVGTTPTRKLTIPSGRHRLEVKCIPDACAQPHVLLSRTITIEPNQLQTVKSGS